jgi:hypothetical protein
MKSILITLLFVCMAAGSAQAQTATTLASDAAKANAQVSVPVANPASTVLRTILPRQQKNILAAIDAMPAEKFTYKPTADQITFAHLVVHITQSNNAMCAKVADIPAPKIDPLADTDSKDKLLAAARASFDFCSGALGKLDDNKMGDNIDFGSFQAPRAMAAFFLTGGWSDHYGAAAFYLRMNEILPPTAQPKK